jgi:hypothetical protein
LPEVPGVQQLAALLVFVAHVRRHAVKLAPAGAKGQQVGLCSLYRVAHDRGALFDNV